MASYARLGMKPPEPPSYDDITQQVIQTFILATRARKYIEGQSLPLTVGDITDVITAHPIDMTRSTLDYIIFALDDLVLSEQREQAKIKDVSSDS